MIKKFNHWIKQILLSNATPQEIAESLALGVFIGFTPTVGFHTWIALGLAVLFKKNKIATLVGAYVTNPFTLIPIFYFCFRFGEWILGYEEPAGFTKALFLHPFSLGGKILIPLWVGSLIMGLVSTVLTYYLSLFFLNRFSARIAAYRKAHHDVSQQG